VDTRFLCLFGVGIFLSISKYKILGGNFMGVRKSVLKRTLAMVVVFLMIANNVIVFADSRIYNAVVPESSVMLNQMNDFLNQASQRGGNPFNIPVPQGITGAQMPAMTGSSMANPPSAPNDVSLSIKEGKTGIGEHSVVLTTGKLRIEQNEFEVSGNGFSFAFTRDYSGNVDTVGAFGKGWRTELGSYLKMYADFHIAEISENGSITTYNFVKDNGSAFVNAYDGDQYINYNLDQGHYEPAANGDVLKRINQYEYVIERADGSKAIFNSYVAPWRTSQPKAEGKIVEKSDGYGNAEKYEYDTNGEMVKITTTSGRVVNIEWQNNLIKRVTGPEGLSYEYGYDANNRLVTIKDSENRLTQYQYDSKDNLNKIIKADGIAESYLYDSSDQVIEIKNYMGNTKFEFVYETNITRVFDGKHSEWTYKYKDDNLIELTSPLGAKTLYTYDSNNNLIKKESNKGIEENKYDDKNRLIEKTDIDGRVSTTKYEDKWNKPIEIVEGNGIKTLYTYDDKGRISTKKVGDTPVVSFEYNGKGHLVKTEFDGKSTGFEYSEEGNLIEETKVSGDKIKYEYDGFGRQVKTIYSDGSKTEMVYDKTGLLLSETDVYGNASNYTYNDSGKILSIKLSDDVETSYEYDNNGNLSASINQNGIKTQYEYDKNNRLIRLKQAGLEINVERDLLGRIVKNMGVDGNIAETSYGTYGVVKTTGSMGSYYYSYDEKGRSTKVEDSMGRTSSLEYNENNQIIKRIDPMGNVYSFEFDVKGNVKAEISPSGKRFEYDYDNLNRAIRVTHPDGKTIEAVYDNGNHIVELYQRNGDNINYNYDANGNLISMSDPEGNKTEYAYDLMGRLVTIKNPNGGIETREYDKAGNLANVTNPEGEKITYAYDKAGRLTKIIDISGASEKYSYDAFGRMISYEGKSGKKIKWTYDMDANSTKVTMADGSELAYRFNEKRQITSFVDFAGNTKVYEYDHGGRRISEKNVLGQITKFEYDRIDRVIGITDFRGAKTSYEYDQDGNVTKMVDAVGNAATSEYDVLGNRVKVTDSIGNVINMDYDIMGNMIRRIDYTGKSEKWEYNHRGQVIKHTDLKDLITAYKYDSIGVATEVSMSNGSIFTYENDKLGRLIALKDPNGNVTKKEYDAYGRLKVQIDPRGGKVQYEYDIDGRLINQIDQEGNSYQYTYDLLGRVKSTIGSLGAKTVYNYDELGHVTSIEDPNGAISSFEYDVLGRIAEAINEEGYSVKYIYDDTLNKQTIINQNGDADVYQYDILGRVVSHVNSIGGETSYEYDVMSNPVNIQYPDGSRYSYTYDAKGNPTEAVDPLGRKTEYSYLPAGQVDSITYANGSQVKYEYNTVGQVTKIIDQNNYNTQLEYDLAGNPIKEIDANGNATSYEYDELNRVKAMTMPNGGVMKYEFTSSGQRSHEIDAYGNKTAYEYDNAGRVIGIVLPNNVRRGFEYDAMGNLIKEIDGEGNEYAFEYNKLNQLVKKVNPYGFETAYTYDNIGNVTEIQNHDGSTVKYQYDALNRVTKEGKLSGAEYQYYYDSMGRLESLTDSFGKSEHWEYDAIGNIAAYTNKKGYTWTYNYDELDRVIAEESPLGHVTAYNYDNNNNLLNIKDPMGQVTEFQYDAKNSLVKVKDAMNVETNYSYDTLGNISAITDGKENVTRKEYDLLGRVTKEVDPMGAETSYAYNSTSQLNSIVDPNGQSVQYAYTPNGAVKNIDFNGAESYSFAYDAVGRVVEASNDTATLRYTYDSMNRVKSQTDVELDKTTRFDYDKSGNTIAITDPEDRVIKYEYDIQNRLTALIDPDERITTFEYDELDREVARDYPNGTSSKKEYNPNGNLSFLGNYRDGEITSSYAYDYDANGNKTYQREEDGAETLFVYDEMNRIEEVYYPVDKIKSIRDQYLETPKRFKPLKGEPKITDLIQEVSFANEARQILLAGKGNDKEKKNDNAGGNSDNSSNGNSNNGNSGGSNWNGNSKSSEKSNSGNSSDKSNNGNGNSDKSDKENGNDKSNRVMPIAKVNGNGKEINYKNVKTNERKNEKVNGKAIGKSKLNKGRIKKLEKLWAWENQVLDVTVVELGYDTYEERPDYLIEISEVVEYEYDELGNRVKMITDQGSVVYTYDKNNRMTSDGNKAYEYDTNGNMIAVTSGEERIQYNYTVANKLAEILYPDETYVKYGYDAYGRKTTREEGYWKIKENNNNNDVKAEATATSNSASDYAPGNGKLKDAQGQDNKIDGPGKSKYAPGQIKKQQVEYVNPLKMETATQRYMYDRFSVNVMKDYTANGSPVSQNYIANGSVASKKMFGLKGAIVPGRETKLDTNGGLMYYQYDGLKNVSALTDRHGDMIEQYRYDVFGNLFTGITAPYNTSSFVGKNYDPKAGLIDNNARWYAPESGRFITADSYRGAANIPYTQNRYAYVGNNPVNRWDPIGYAEQDFEENGGEEEDDGNYCIGVETKTWWETVDRWTERGSKHSSESMNEARGGYETYWYRNVTEYTVKKFYDALIFVYKNPKYNWGFASITTHYFEESWRDSGSGFRPFTSGEWYEVHKDDLKNAAGELPNDIELEKEYRRFEETHKATSSSTRNLIGESQTRITEDLINQNLSEILSGGAVYTEKTKDRLLSSYSGQTSGATMLLGDAYLEQFEQALSDGLAKPLYPSNQNHESEFDDYLTLKKDYRNQNGTDFEDILIPDVVDKETEGTGEPEVPTSTYDGPSSPIYDKKATNGDFGTFYYRDLPYAEDAKLWQKGLIEVDPAWVAENIVKMELPENLQNLPEFLNVKSLRVNKAVLSNWEQVFDTLSNNPEILEQINSLDPGTFWTRHIRNSVDRGISNHSWGTAIDINAWNHDNYVDPKTNPDDPNLRLWKDVFEPAGFSWGNDYSDSMHFEILGK